MKRIAVLLIAAVMAFGEINLSESSLGLDVYKKSIDAIYAKKNGKYEEAVRLYKELFEKTKKGEYLLGLVESYYKSGDFDSIIPIVNENYKSYPKYAQKLLEYEVLGFLKAGDLESAENVVKLKMQRGEFYYNMLAFISSERGDSENEIKYLEGLYSFNPSEKNLFALTDVLVKNGYYDRAVSYLRSYVYLHTPTVNVYRKLAGIYRIVGDFDDLFEVYESISKLDSSYSKQELLLALRYKKEKIDYVLTRYPVCLSNKLLLNKSERVFLTKRLLKLLKKENKKEYLRFVLGNLEDIEIDKSELDFIASLVNALNDERCFTLFGRYLVSKGDRRGLDFLRTAFLKGSSPKRLWDLSWGLYQMGECKKAWELVSGVDFSDDNITSKKELIKRCANDFAKNSK